MNEQNIEDIYELSPVQQGILFHTLYSPKSGMYFQQFYWTFKGNLDVLKFKQAWQKVINRHSILRTSFYWENVEKPYQVVYRQVELPWEQQDWRQLSEVEQKQRLDASLKVDQERGFEVSKAPLMRLVLIQLASDIYQLVWSYHHILLDGWSLPLIYKEVLTFYEAFCQNQDLNLKQPRSYRDYITWLQQQDLSKAETFWRRSLNGIEAPTPLRFAWAIDTLENQPEDLQHYQQIHLSKAATSDLKLLAQQYQLTLNTLAQGAWALLLSHYSNSDDVIFGTTSTGRPVDMEGVESMVGLFISTLPVRVKVSPKENLLFWLKKLQAQQLEMRQYEYSPLIDIQEWSGVPRSLPMFESLIVFENTPINTSLQEKGSSLQIIDSGTFEKTHYPLTIGVEPNEELSLEIYYDYCRFPDATITRMLEHLRGLLEGMVVNPERCLTDVMILTEGERQQLLFEWNNTYTDDVKDLCIHRLFETQVEQTPDAIAVVFEDEQLTYRELNARANQLARYLQVLGVKSEILVGICAEKSLELIVGVLGVLKAGGAYVPIDPTYPQERLVFMLEDAQAAILLTQQRLIEMLPVHNAKVVFLDTDWEEIAQKSRENLLSNVTAANLAYAIYTSGSTGKSKGVMVEHSNFTNAYLAWEKAYKLRSETRCHFQMASFSFDVFGGDLVRALCSGGKLVLCTRELLLDAKKLYQLMRQTHVDCAEFVPAVLRNLMQYLEESGQSLDFMQLVVCGSDSWYGFEYKKFQRFCSAKTRLLNSYGLTEATIDSSYFETVEVDLPIKEFVPIGRPFANTQLYILNRYLQPTPIGVVGELYIGGVGLARGYWNRADLTAEKFIPNPFSVKTGARLYKTGDQACWLSNGNIELLGRIDNQVKIRGFRIEPGEIESVIKQNSAVQNVIVQARENDFANKRLVAYVVPNSQSEALNRQIPGVELTTELLSQWQVIFDDLYRETARPDHLKFRIDGWDSSYTGMPFAEEEVREWMNQTVERILSLQPTRVLELGCGTGLMLFRIAPYCQQYWATDQSKNALAVLQYQLTHLEQALSGVTVINRRADDFEGVVANSLNAVLLVSVVQYFPSIDYLLKIIEKAINVVEPGGFIFLGDIRSLPLLEAFHASVQIYRAPSSLSTAELQQRVRKQLLEEKQLVVDPAFFIALKQHLPKISHIEILLERGCHHNELTKFRYDVVLHVGKKLPTTDVRWLDWEEEGLTLPYVRQLLVETKPEFLGIASVPNARVALDLKTLELIKNSEGIQTVGELRESLQEQVETDIDPEHLWALSEELPYCINITYSNSGADGRYDVLFIRNSAAEAKTTTVVAPASTKKEKAVSIRPWSSYGNNPLYERFARDLVPHLRNFLKDKLPDYMIPSSFVVLEALPLLPNGKVDRRSLPEPDAARPKLETAFVAPRVLTEELLAGIWSNVLKLEKVGIYDNFFELGGHSLLAIRLISQVCNTFQVELSLRSLFESPTIASLSNHIETFSQEKQGLRISPIVPNSREDLSLSFTQQQIWGLDEQMKPDDYFYNTPTSFKVKGLINIIALEQSLKEILRRHETLRTTFTVVDGQIVKAINPNPDLKLLIVDFQELPKAERETEARRLAIEDYRQPFDLAKEPLLRTTLFRLDEAEYALQFTIHQLAFDAWSRNVFLQELKVLYKAFSTGQPSPLPELSIQYGDFANWQEQWWQEVREVQLFYWKQQLAGLPVLQLPTDYPRPAIKTYRGATQLVMLPRSLTNALRGLSQQEEVTFFMTLLAAYNTWLYSYTGQEDILVGTSTANRIHDQIENLIGCFNNYLVLRNDLSGNLSFRELLARVRKVTLEAYAHQNMPIIKLVEHLNIDRDLSRTPLFQAMLIYKKFLDVPTFESLDLTVSSFESPWETARCDLTMSLTDDGQEVTGYFEYSIDLFKETTITRMLRDFQILLECIVANPDQCLLDLQFVTKAKQHQ